MPGYVNQLIKPVKNRFQSASLLCVGLAMTLLLSGCSEQMVHNRSIADLNKKANELMQKGDTAGAVGRLESALDLNPNEPNTLYNLAIAYQANHDYDKSIRAFESLAAMKQLPANLNMANILQSLGVVYEEKADTLVTKSTEALEAKKPDEAAQYQTDAINAYEKAKDAYAQELKTETGKKMAPKIGTQTEAIDKKIEELKQPQQPG